jgi:uncharacterized alkaline shock family protein YloU
MGETNIAPKAPVSLVKIARKAKKAIRKVEGVVRLSARYVQCLSWTRGISVVEDEAGRLTIHTGLIIEYGRDPRIVGRLVERAIIETVEDLSNHRIGYIKIIVAGTRPAKRKAPSA